MYRGSREDAEMRWSSGLRLLAVLAVVGAGIGTRTAGGGELEVLLEKVAGAYGGEKALARLVAFRETGTVRSKMRGVEGELVRIYRHPGDLRVEISYPGMEREVRVLNGREGWRQGKPVSGPPFEAMVLQAARLALPRNLLSAAGRIADLGTVRRDGKGLRALSFSPGEGMSMRVEVDPDSGRILRSLARSESGLEGMPGGIGFETVFEDFREVDGVRFPFLEQNFAMGRHTGETVLNRVEILAAAPEGSFRP